MAIPRVLLVFSTRVDCCCCCHQSALERRVETARRMFFIASEISQTLLSTPLSAI